MKVYLKLICDNNQLKYSMINNIRIITLLLNIGHKVLY
jgi:hypothetical protein